MLDIQPLTRAKIRSKRVLMRVDFNAEVNHDGSFDDFRLKSALKSVKWVISQKPEKLILLSHIGKNSTEKRALTLLPTAKRFGKMLGKKISFINDLEQCSRKQPLKSDIFLLENLRKYSGEEQNDFEFAKRLSLCGDLFINEAFSVSHRSHASIASLPKILPSYAGFNLINEVKNLEKLLNKTKKPFIVLIGGAKISTKLPTIKKLLLLADFILTGGGVANTFLKTAGYPIGKSICEEKLIPQIKSDKILENKKLKIPRDFFTAEDYKTKKSVHKYISEVTPSDYLLDIGSQTVKEYSFHISRAKTILWSGPMGYFENPLFSKSTCAVLKTIGANKKAFKVAGGGETIAAIRKYKAEKYFSFISTGGGAMLEFLAGNKLPGIEALKLN